MSQSYDGWKDHLAVEDSEPVDGVDDFDADGLADVLEAVDPVDDYDNPARFQRISSTEHWPGDFRDYTDIEALNAETEQDWEEPRYEFVLQLPEMADADDLDIYANGNIFELRHDDETVFEYHTPVKQESDVYTPGTKKTYRADMELRAAEMDVTHDVVTVSVPVERDFDHGL